ncbi:MAG: hypothetical protein LBN00_11945 [Oscillospiraceae bacterium]|jgi:hypothetical protein|nr:hypothetical protein [Oscillospiraceae bacterium]
MEQAFIDYADAVVAPLKSDKLRTRARAELVEKAKSYYELAIENGAAENEAVRAAVYNMGDAAEMTELMRFKYKKHLSAPQTCFFAACFVLFFVVMGIISHGEIFTELNPVEFLIILGIAAALAFIVSVWRFTWQKFLVGMEFGGAVSGIAYLTYRMYSVYTGSLEQLALPAVIRANIGMIMLIIVYAVAIVFVADTLNRRLYPPAYDFVAEIFLDREYQRIKLKDR